MQFELKHTPNVGFIINNQYFRRLFQNDTPLIFVYAGYNNYQKHVPIDLTCLSSVIASEAKQSLRLSKGLLRRQAPRNDRLSEQILTTAIVMFY
jgi:hypothetical protein